MSSIEKSIETDNSLISGSQKRERELGVIAGGTGLFFSFFLSFRHFLGRSQGIWRFPGWGLIGAVAAGLCQGHSNAGSELSLQPTPQLTATLDP